MKKILTKLLCIVFVACMALTAFVGCGDPTKGYTPTLMNNWGDVLYQNSYVAVTENYVYYINGISPATSFNTYGYPVKGALMVADKNDLSKTAIAVPKLFSAGDYNSGFYILGDYVYFATPSDEQDTSGTVLTDNLAFARARLDGSYFETFFTVSGNATEHRFFESNGIVYIVYYNTASSSLVCYNTATKTGINIATTNDKAQTYSLNDYQLFDNGKDVPVVAYTTTVYSEPYYQDKINAGGTRQTESYNQIYVYRLGDQVNETGFYGELVVDGKDAEKTYSINLVQNGYFFYNETDVDANAVTYGVEINELAKTTAIELQNAQVATETAFVVSPSEVYNITDGKLYKQSLTDKSVKETVLVNSQITTILYIHDNFVYFRDANNVIFRAELNNVDTKTVRISNGVVTGTWYTPELVEINGKDYLFYTDDTETGCFYVNCIALDGDVVGEDTDNDDIEDTFHLAGSMRLGFMNLPDMASSFSAEIKAIASSLKDGALVLEEVDGKLVNKDVEQLRAKFNGFVEAVKHAVSQEDYQTLLNYEKAIEMANVYNKLSAVKDYEWLTEQEKTDLETAYNSVKLQITAFRYSYNYTTVRGFINKDLLRHYQKAEGLFEKD